MMSAVALRCVTIVGTLSGFCCLALETPFHGRCPSDDVIIARFERVKGTLNELLNMVAADGERVSYVGHGVVTVSGNSLSEVRKEEYLAKVRAIRADFFSYTRNKGATVGLWTDALSITAHSRFKGLTYVSNIKQSRYIQRSSLDGLESYASDGVYVRSLSGNWYIVYIQG